MHHSGRKLQGRGQGYDGRSDINCNSQKRHPSPTKRTTETNHHVGRDYDAQFSNEMRNDLFRERALRNSARARARNRKVGSTEKMNELKQEASRALLIDDKEPLCIEEETYKKVQLHKAVIHELSKSVCALDELAGGLSETITNVKAQHRETLLLLNSVFMNFEELSNCLTDVPRFKSEHILSGDKRQDSKIDQEPDSITHKLVLPKIPVDTGSRPNSTVSIFQRQLAQQNEDNEVVNREKMSHIKKIARKKSQEKALKDKDLQPVHTGNGTVCTISSTESVKEVRKKKNKSGKRKVTENQLKEIDEIQDNYVLPIRKGKTERANKRPQTLDNKKERHAQSSGRHVVTEKHVYRGRNNFKY